MSHNVPQLPRFALRAILVRDPKKLAQRLAARASSEQRVPVQRALPPTLPSDPS